MLNRAEVSAALLHVLMTLRRFYKHTAHRAAPFSIISYRFPQMRSTVSLKNILASTTDEADISPNRHLLCNENYRTSLTQYVSLHKWANVLQNQLYTKRPTCKILLHQHPYNHRRLLCDPICDHQRSTSKGAFT